MSPPQHVRWRNEAAGELVIHAVPVRVEDHTALCGRVAPYCFDSREPRRNCGECIAILAGKAVPVPRHRDAGQTEGAGDFTPHASAPSPT